MTSRAPITDWERDISIALGEHFPGTTHIDPDRDVLERDELAQWVDRLRAVTTPIFDVPAPPSVKRPWWSKKVFAAAACTLIGIAAGLAIMNRSKQRLMPPPATDASDGTPPIPPGMPAAMPIRTLAEIREGMPDPAPGVTLTRGRLKARGTGGTSKPGAPSFGASKDPIEKKLGFSLTKPRVIPPKYALANTQVRQVQLGELVVPAAWLLYEGPHGAFGVLEFKSDPRLLERGSLNADLASWSVRTSETHIAMVVAPTATESVREALTTMMFPGMEK